MNTVISFLLFSSLASAVIGASSKIQHFGCDPAQQEQIKKAATASDDMVTRARSYLSGLGSNPPNQLYTDSFGPFNELTSPIVKARFDVIIKNKATLLTYDCTACQNERPRHYDGLYTYVNLEKSKIDLSTDLGYVSEYGTTGTRLNIKSRAELILRDNLILHINDKVKIVSHLGAEIEASGVADLPEYSEPWDYVNL
ncbi:hypothetical protein RSAG8_12041, partial [Rhizoctonia solani AG-8 WAC10335]